MILLSIFQNPMFMWLILPLAVTALMVIILIVAGRVTRRDPVAHHWHKHRNHYHLK